MAVSLSEAPEGQAVSATDSPLVIYQAAFSRVAGSVSCGLVLARSVALQYEAEIHDRPQWPCMAERWYQELGITRSQLETAVRKLTERGLIKTEVRGLPPTKHFRVCWPEFKDAWRKETGEPFEKWHGHALLNGEAPA